MQQLDGSIREIAAEEAGTLRRIFAAGNREAPIYKIGEEVIVSGGRFKVLAFGGKLLVLEGVELGAPQKDTAVESLERALEGRY